MQDNQINLLSYFKIFIYFIFYIFLSILFCLIIAKCLNSSMIDFFSIDIAQLISTILILKYIKRKFNITLKSLIDIKNINLIMLVLIILFSLSSYVTINSLIATLNNNIPLLQATAEHDNSIDNISTIYLLLFFTSISIVSPIIEEIIFRGIFLLKLKDNCNKIIALIFSSLLFAILHCSGSSQVSAFFSGLLWGIIVLKTNSIFYTIISHIIWNSFTTLLLFINIYNPNMLLLYNGSIHFNIFTTIFSTIISVIIFLIIFKFQFIITIIKSKLTHN